MRAALAPLVCLALAAAAAAPPARGSGQAAPAEPAAVRLPLEASPPEAPPRRNSHPIVLVHGFLGFARRGPAGLNYWGGKLDIPAELRVRGFEVYAADVGPVSSSWDRACELFACLRGGRVDYGAAHARACGHDRYGALYPGLLPDWGENRRVHLVGHSMGGQTARLMVTLLEEGDAAEAAATRPGELSPLFAGGHIGEQAWVRSVTTIATPHDGTPAACRFNLSSPGLRRFAAGLYYRGVACRPRSPARLGLDLRLEAWGLAPGPGECETRSRRRFAEADAWWRSRDTGMWDGSPEGARELNLRAGARPDVYYFSWAAEQTTRHPITGRYVPEPRMSFLIYSQAGFIGAYHSDPQWWPNDGIVSTCSMDGPSLGSADRIEAFTGVPRPGVWNFMGVLQSLDHLDLIGVPSAREKPSGYESLPEWYASIAAFIARLEP